MFAICGFENSGEYCCIQVCTWDIYCLFLSIISVHQICITCKSICEITVRSTMIAVFCYLHLIYKYFNYCFL